MDVEDLALPQQLPSDGLGGGRLLELAHVGEDRPPGRRRGVDHRQVADAGEGHLEGAGDGAGRQGQHVHPVGHGLDRLLVADPEALLLVDHQEAQLLEGDVLAEQPVGAHHHVDRTVGQPGQHRLGLGVGEEAAEQLHLAPGTGAYRSAKVWACWLASRVVGTSTAAWYPSWTALNTARMATSVLPKPTSPQTSRSMGWGRSMSALTSSMARSWSEVSTNGNDDSSSACHGVSGPKACPVHLEPAAVQGHQLLGDLVHGGPGLGPGLLPLRPAQPADRRRVPAGVGGEQLDLVGGQVQLVAAPVLEEQVVAGGAPHGPGDHAAVRGHPVLAVDHVAARGQVVEEAVDRSGPGPGLAVGPAPAGDVGLGQHGHPAPGSTKPRSTAATTMRAPGRRGRRPVRRRVPAAPCAPPAR